MTYHFFQKTIFGEHEKVGFKSDYITIKNPFNPLGQLLNK